MAGDAVVDKLLGKGEQGFKVIDDLIKMGKISEEQIARLAQKRLEAQTMLGGKYKNPRTQALADWSRQYRRPGSPAPKKAKAKAKAKGRGLALTEAERAEPEFRSAVERKLRERAEKKVPGLVKQRFGPPVDEPMTVGGYDIGKRVPGSPVDQRNPLKQDFLDELQEATRRQARRQAADEGLTKALADRPRQGTVKSSADVWKDWDILQGKPPKGVGSLGEELYERDVMSVSGKGRTTMPTPPSPTPEAFRERTVSDLMEINKKNYPSLPGETIAEYNERLAKLYGRGPPKEGGNLGSWGGVEDMEDVLAGSREKAAEKAERALLTEGKTPAIGDTAARRARHAAQRAAGRGVGRAGKGVGKRLLAGAGKALGPALGLGAGQLFPTETAEWQGEPGVLADPDVVAVREALGMPAPGADYETLAAPVEAGEPYRAPKIWETGPREWLERLGVLDRPQREVVEEFAPDEMDMPPLAEIPLPEEEPRFRVDIGRPMMEMPGAYPPALEVGDRIEILRGGGRR